MNRFKIDGTLHKVFPTENKTETFQAREFVITTQDGNYQQFVKFQLTQDRCQLVDNYKPGQLVTVHFDIRGREWQDKYFTNLNAWKVESELLQPEPADDYVTDPTGIDDTDINDLPF